MRKTFRKPYRVKKKKSIFKNRFFWLIILILVIGGGIFYSLLFSEIFQVKKIIVTGEKKISSREIKLAVESKLEKKILLFQTKSIFLLDLNKTREELLNNFPEMVEIEIHRSFPDTLNIIVMERFAIAIFCQTEQCFLLDNEGVIFEEALKEDFQLPKVKNPNLNKLELGERIIEKELLSEILTIFSRLENLQILIKEASIVSGERINIKTLEGWEIYFNPQRDLDWQITKLGAVLEKYIPPEERKDLEYIELRFGDLAPFKYQD